MERRLYQQEVVADLGQQALETDTIDQLMHDACIAVADILDTEYSKVLELLPGGDEVFLRQGIGWRDGLVGAATVPTDLDSQAGYTLITEEPVIVDNLRTEDRFSGPELLTSHDVVSGISVIIGSVEKPWGVLGTHTSERREFTTLDANFVKSVANVIASAVARHEHEEELARTVDLFEQTERIADVGGWDIDAETLALSWTDHIYDLLDLPHEYEPDIELFFDAVHDDDEERARTALNAALEDWEKIDLEIRVFTPEGEMKWLHIQGNPETVDGGVVRIRGAAQDVTERMEREQELKRANRRTELALTATDATIWEWDVETDNVWTHPDPDGLLQTRIQTSEEFFDSVHPEDRQEIKAAQKEAIETQTPYHAEFRYERDGETRWAQDYGEPFEPTEGGGRRMIGAAYDITERKEREQALEESHKRLGEFATAVSHDLREPLGTIASYLQLLERRYEEDLDDDAREFVDFAVSGATRMREMIDGLVRTYARVDQDGDTFEPVDLHVVLEDVERDLDKKIETSGAEITADSLPSVSGDYGQLEQVLMNLIDNAIKYSGDESPRIHLSAERDDGMWVVSVQDEGIGMKPEKTGNVFNVFTRVHSKEEYPGTGIGLALCDRIIERHGGDIWVESEPGEGSTFSFTVPAVSSTDL